MASLKASSILPLRKLTSFRSSYVGPVQESTNLLSLVETVAIFLKINQKECTSLHSLYSSFFSDRIINSIGQKARTG